MMKRLRITVCALLVLMLLSGCAASQSSMKATTEESYNYAYDTAAAEEPAYEPETSMTTAESESAAGGFDAGEADPNYGNHKIITTYSFEMRTDEFDNHFKQLQDKAAQLGGYVQSSSVSGTKPETYSDYGRTANLTFRIPTAKVKEFVDFTQGTGEITYSNCDTEDITLNYFDTETRLGVLRDQLDRLKEIMKTTGNMEDLVELEKAISETTLEIEQYTTQLRRYDDLVDYTTVYVTINENRLTKGPAAKEGMGERMSAGLSESFVAVGVFLENALVAIVCAIPAILVIAVLAAIVVLIVKLIKKGKARNAVKREAKAQERRERMEKLSANKIEEQKNIVASTQSTDGYYDTRSTVRVTGTGTVSIKPDIAEVGFTVRAQEKDVSEAQQQNAKLMEAVLEVIKTRGIAEEDIETGYLNINEVRDYSKNTSKVVGYEVYHTVNVKVRDMDVLGSLISEAVAAGASDVSGPEYSIEDDSEAYLQALGMAVESAGAKARAIAAGAGVRLTNLPISIDENGGADSAVVYDNTNKTLKPQATAAPAEDALTEAQTVMPTIKVTATVDATYQIMR